MSCVGINPGEMMDVDEYDELCWGLTRVMDVDECYELCWGLTQEKLWMWMSMMNCVEDQETR